MTPEQIRSAISAWNAAIDQHGGAPTDGTAPDPIARMAAIEAAARAVGVPMHVISRMEVTA